MAAAQDAPLQTLFLPFASGSLPWPQGPVLFLRAREGWPLREHAAPGQLVCVQSFRPFAQALERGGWEVRDEAAVEDTAATYPLVLVLPPRQRDEARALLARALAQLAPGGVLVACQANSEGARSGESDLERLAGLGGKLTKNHCRVYWSAPRDSRLGVFAWDRIDRASALLVEQLPPDLAGRGADLGAGWGYLSAELLARCPGVTALDLYEAESRALALARHNLAGSRAQLDFRWHDVTAGIDGRYDFVVSNPPFHTPAREDRPDIGQRFIAVAAQALRPGGRLFMVANRHLPYEQILNDSFGQVLVAAERDGFKVIVGTRGGRA